MTDILRARRLEETCNLCKSAFIVHISLSTQVPIVAHKATALKVCTDQGSDHYKHIFIEDHPTCLNFEPKEDKNLDNATDPA